MGKNQEKKPLYKKWWFWVIIVIVLAGIGGAIGGSESSKDNRANETVKTETDNGSNESSDTSNETQTETKEELTLDDGWTIDKSNPYATYVNGYVSNNTDKAITNYVQITFTALDAEGANVGDCLANANTIDANGKWKFQAMCSGDDIETIRFKEITGF